MEAVVLAVTWPSSLMVVVYTIGKGYSLYPEQSATMGKGYSLSPEQSGRHYGKRIIFIQNCPAATIRKG